MKKYEGLFILNTAGKDEGAKDMIDKIVAEITAAGGKVETIQKMDRRPFARVSDKRVSAGFYVNIIFECAPDGVAQLRARFTHSEDVFRVMFSVAPKTAAPVPAPAAV